MAMAVPPPAARSVVVTVIVEYPNTAAPMSVAVMPVTMLGTMVHSTTAVRMAHFTAAGATPTIGAVFHSPATAAAGTVGTAALSLATSASAIAVIFSGHGRHAKRETGR
jgi:hypothetical protein